MLGKSFKESVENIVHTLQRFGKPNLKLKVKKCTLFQNEVEFLGHQVSSQGISIPKEKSEEILQWPLPKNKDELILFLSFANYRQSFVQGFAGIVGCLYELTRQNVPYNSKDEFQNAFDKL